MVDNFKIKNNINYVYDLDFRMVFFIEKYVSKWWYIELSMVF